MIREGGRGERSTALVLSQFAAQMPQKIRRSLRPALENDDAQLSCAEGEATPQPARCGQVVGAIGDQHHLRELDGPPRCVHTGLDPLLALDIVGCHCGERARLVLPVPGLQQGIGVHAERDVADEDTRAEHAQVHLRGLTVDQGVQRPTRIAQIEAQVPGEVPAGTTISDRPVSAATAATADTVPSPPATSSTCAPSTTAFLASDAASS